MYVNTHKYTYIIYVYHKDMRINTQIYVLTYIRIIYVYTHRYTCHMAIGYFDQPDWILTTQKVAIMFIIKNDHFRPFFGPDRPQGFPTWLPISIYTHKYMYIHTIVCKYTQIYVYDIRICAQICV